MFKTFLIIAALIAYGSLYTSDFSGPLSGTRADLGSLGLSTLFHSLPDILGNLALFLPLGIVGALALDRSTRLGRFLLVTLFALVFAFLLQLAQLYIPGRVAALSDVFWNTLGAATGAIIGEFLRRLAWTKHRSIQAQTAILVAIGSLWFAWQLLPFVPSLDLRTLKNGLKDIWYHHDISPPTVLLIASCLMVLGRLLVAAVGERRELGWLLLLGLATLFGKVVVVTQILEVSMVLGVVLGLLLWWMIRGIREPDRSGFLFFALILSFSMLSLEPFRLSGSQGAFNWIPFAGLLQGSMLSNAQALSGKLFVYAGLLWLILAVGGRVLAGAVAIAIWVILLEMVQTFLPERSASISEPIWVMLIAWALHSVHQNKPFRALDRASIHRYATDKKSERSCSERHGSVGSNREPDNVCPKSDSDLVKTSGRDWKSDWRVWFVVVCVGFAALLSLVLQLPNIPYNVAELFRLDGSFPVLLLFAVALLWIGIGSGWLARLLRNSKKPWISIPIAVLAISLVSLFLFRISVTVESIGDIAGSSNIYWFVTNKQIWGVWAKNLFEAMNTPGLIGAIERWVRYTALIGPLLIFLALMLLVLEQGRQKIQNLLLIILSSIPWLWLCKAVAFDWSSTDNLNELIARPGDFGLGGGGYLYLLVALVSLSAVMLGRLARTPSQLLLGSVIVIGFLPIGWFLLNFGLESEIEKYGLVFSGAQFLLGPDRQNMLSEQVLFLRWCVVQFAAVVVLAAGLRFSYPILDWIKIKRVAAISPMPTHRRGEG